MSAELLDHEFGAAHAPGKTDARPVTHPGHERAATFTCRLRPPESAGGLRLDLPFL